MNLTHKFSASPTGRYRFPVFNNRYDSLDYMFPMRNHCRNSTVFRTKPHTAGSVNANAKIDVAFIRNQCASNVAYCKSVLNPPWSKYRFCLYNQFFITYLSHKPHPSTKKETQKSRLKLLRYVTSSLPSLTKKTVKQRHETMVREIGETESLVPEGEGKLQLFSLFFLPNPRKTAFRLYPSFPVPAILHECDGTSSIMHPDNDLRRIRPSYSFRTLGLLEGCLSLASSLCAGLLSLFRLYYNRGTCCGY